MFQRKITYLLFIFVTSFSVCWAPTSYDLTSKVQLLSDSLGGFTNAFSDLAYELENIRRKLKEESEPTKTEKNIEEEFEPEWELEEETEETFLRDLSAIEVPIGPDVPRMNILRKSVLKDMYDLGEGVVATKNLEAFLAAESPDEFEQFLAGLAYEKGGKQLAPNEVRMKLAKKWVRNAATRIFHDYMRSFLELIVNSCDTTIEKFFEKKGVGKFGMGFFSILSFLWHREDDWPLEAGSKIIITTAVRKNPVAPLFSKIPLT